MAVPNDLRQINRRRVVLAALRAGHASRSQLARATGLSLPTAGKIVDELVADRVLSVARSTDRSADAGEAPARLGRPGQYFRLDGTARLYVAVQLGVANTRLATLAAAPPGDDVWTATFTTPTTARAWAAAVVEATKRLVARPRAVIVSVPGVVDESTGTIRISPNVHWADGVNVPSLLKAASLKCPVHVVQEIRGLALGALAADPTARDFLLVDFGNGIGSTAVINGKVYRGNLPMIGEIGHTAVAGNARPCGCGAKGCLETLVSRGAIGAAVLGMRRRPGSDVDRSPGGMWQDVVSKVATRGVTGEFAKAIDAAGAGIAAAINMLGVDRVVVTGSLTEFPPTVLDRLATAVRRHAFWARVADVTIVAAPRRRLAGLGYVVIDRIIAPVTSSTNRGPIETALGGR